MTYIDEMTRAMANHPAQKAFQEAERAARIGYRPKPLHPDHQVCKRPSKPA